MENYETYEKLQDAGKEYFKKVECNFPSIMEKERDLSKNFGRGKKEIPELRICLVKEQTEYEKVDGRGFLEYDDYYIYINDTEDTYCVFHAVQDNNKDIEIRRFAPGNWQEELLKHFKMEKSPKRNKILRK